MDFFESAAVPTKKTVMTLTSHPIQFFVQRFRERSLDWLYLQYEAKECNLNGVNYKRALEILISEKEEDGETRSKRRKPSFIIATDDSDKDYVRRPLQTGPGGQTEVHRIHKSVFCGD